ncbi:MAG: adenylosuccinate synthase [Deltaproteobacteria bacterium]|nr:adenylosuccinate synthase [Deltaproteobacteria bacterium]
MPAIVIVGAQWGDEGKGKVTDYLAREADTVVRYQGGNNAGHTIVVGGSTYRFHLIPSGMLHRDKTCVLGNGVVIDPEELLAELDALAAQKVDTSRLIVSSQAHYILPTHQVLDRQAEARKGAAKIGTTGRGIGPAYQDKVNRCGIRLSDPAHPERLRQKLAAHLEEHRADLAGCDWTLDRLLAHLTAAHGRLRPYIGDASMVVNDVLDRGGRVLFEGAQGTLLDIDHGTYPFVTSSSPTAGGACLGAGIGPTRIDRVVGVAKAYATRVGSGPFPTELATDPVGAKLRERGKEFGTTTGRPRRCGWLDLVALRYAVRVNGITQLAITKLDVLDEFESLQVATAYKVNGTLTREFPTAIEDLEVAEPVYETLPGWRASCSAAKTWSDLPAEATAYVARLEDYLRVPVALLSIGAERSATFSRLALWEPL